MSRVFFVTGRGRSGTWLLQSILSRHPDICLAPESVFAMLLRRTYDQNTPWKASKNEPFIQDLFREEKISAWWKLDRSSLQELLNEQASVGNLQTYGDVCHAVYRCYAAQTGKASAVVVGDKNPEYSLFQKPLLELFPEAVFLHMVRDPRDTILSYQKVNFDLNHPVSLAERWRQYNRKAIAFSKQHPDRIRFLKFEDLLTKPQKVLEQCFSLLDLPPCPDILDRTHDSNTILSYNTKIQNPLDPSRCEQWKKSPEGSTLPNVVNEICREELAFFGYEAGTPTAPGPIDRFHIGMGRIMTWLEQGLFKLPPAISLSLLSAYRRKTGVLELAEDNA